MRPFILSSVLNNQQSGRVHAGGEGRRHNPFNDTKPTSPLRQERTKWYRIIEERCAYFIKELDGYQSKIDELCTRNPSAIPKLVRRNRIYPGWWIKSVEASEERPKKNESYRQSFDEFMNERTILVKAITELEKEVRTAHTQFSATDVWNKNDTTPLVYGYYRLATEFTWFQTDVQNMLRTETPAPTTVPPLSATMAKEPPHDDNEERIRRSRNWIYVLLFWYKSRGPFVRDSKWLRMFDWIAAITLLLLPFLPAFLAYLYSCSHLVLLALGYYTWLFMYQSFVIFPESCTVIWPAFYLSPCLTFGAFFSVAASHAVFALALPVLTRHAEESTKR